MFKKRSKLILFGSHFLFLYNYMMLYYAVGAVVQSIRGHGDIILSNGIITITVLKLASMLLSGIFAGIIIKIFLSKMKVWKKILFFIATILASFVIILTVLGLIDWFDLSNIHLIELKLPYFILIFILGIVAKILYDKFLLAD